MKKQTKSSNASALSFWNSAEKLKRIKIINPGDVRIEESLTKLGLSIGLKELGICDPAEVLERNKILRFLSENTKIRKQVVQLSYLKSKMALPTSENEFLFFYSKVENPYWDAVKQLVVSIKAVKNLPLALTKFVDQLEADLFLEVKERLMADKISPLLNGVAEMEGTFSIQASVDRNGLISASHWPKDIYVHGYKKFSMSYASEYTATLPEWLNGGFYRKTGINFLVQMIADDLVKRRSRNSSFIHNLTDGVKNDLYTGFDQVMKDYQNKSLVEINDVKFNFYFSYGCFGLEVKLISMDLESYDKKVHWKLKSQILQQYPGAKKGLQKKSLELSKNVTISIAKAKAEPLFYVLKELIGNDTKLDSSRSDADFKWYAIGHIYNSDDFKSLYEQLVGQRDFFFGTLKNLKSLSDILTVFEQKAEALKLPLCIPTISEDHSGVFFKNLVPISLVGSGLTTIVPITLDRINGQMVGLTGRHGGGKTTIGKNILQNIYFAMSGLPVFAETFNTDIKTVLGAVTNDEGSGSTATVFVQKVTNLMKEIREVPSHESLVFIDEIGKGTQQEAGLELGKAILSALNKGGNSVLFNTQILELAEYAQENLNAVCYKANRQFEFTKGVSGGEIGELVKELGLDKYLN